MDKIASLSGYLSNNKWHLSVLLWGEDTGVSFKTRPPYIVVIANDSTLAVVASFGNAADVVGSILKFSKNFNHFSFYQRKWNWSSVLEAKLDRVIEKASASMMSSAQGPCVVYLYLNSEFCKKSVPLPSNFSGNKSGAKNIYYRDDCRTDTPSVEDILRAFGTASILNTVLFPVSGEYCFHCYSEYDGLGAVGRGNNEKDMIRGAVFEYCERWASQQLPENTIIGKYFEIAERALRPDEIVQSDERKNWALFPGFSRDQPIRWIPARFSCSGKHVLLPLAMVNYRNELYPNFSFMQNSNGCALGNSLDEAALFSVLEVIERDALLLTWYSRSTPPRISTKSISVPAITENLRFLASIGYETYCFDITTEFGVPTVLILLKGQSELQPGVFLTAASHPNPRIALHSALSEASSLIGRAERNFRRSLHDTKLPLLEGNQYLFYAQHSQLEHFDFLLRGRETLEFADFVSLYSSETSDAGKVLENLACRAATLGYETLIVDNTPEALASVGLYSARAFIPGTIPLTFNKDLVYIPERRLARAADKCDWVSDATDLSQVLPHPFG